MDYLRLLKSGSTSSANTIISRPRICSIIAHVMTLSMKIPPVSGRQIILQLKSTLSSEQAT